jgi:DNA-binding transcriptional MerR regulator
MARIMVALKIGAFARRASVSIKTLRFYDRVGVFRPAHVDPRSGYRYYGVDQLATIWELRMLRELGCSVADLRAWIEAHAASDRQTALLLSFREIIRHRLSNERRRLRAIDEWIQGLASASASFGSAVPSARSISPVPAFTLRDRVRVVDPTVYKMFEAAERTVARQSARVARRPFLLFHDDDYRDTLVDVEVCVPIRSDSLRAVGGRTVEGALRAACLGFSGSYSRAPATFQTIKRWMRVAGVHSAGPIRETYLRFGADQRGYQLPKRFIASTVMEYRTELQVPFADA